MRSGATITILSAARRIAKLWAVTLATGEQLLR
jgi:hypothetical protein